MTDVIEVLADAIHKKTCGPFATIDPQQCVYGRQRDTALASEILATLESSGSTIVRAPKSDVTRLVEVSVMLGDLFGTRTETGSLLAFEWGESRDGVYSPVFTATDDGHIIVKRWELEQLDGAFDRLWSNGPVIDTIADWGRDWEHDPDQTFYDLLDGCRQAVRAALTAKSSPSEGTE